MMVPERAAQARSEAATAWAEEARSDLNTADCFPLMQGDDGVWCGLNAISEKDRQDSSFPTTFEARTVADGDNNCDHDHDVTIARTVAMA